MPSRSAPGRAGSYHRTQLGRGPDRFGFVFRGWWLRSTWSVCGKISGPNGSQIGLFLARVVGIQAWLTLRLKELLFSVGGLFLGVHRHEHPSVQPSPASHDSPNVQFGITLVGIFAADDVLFRHQIRIRAQLRPRRRWRVQS